MQSQVVVPARRTIGPVTRRPRRFCTPAATATATASAPPPNRCLPYLDLDVSSDRAKADPRGYHNSVMQITNMARSHLFSLDELIGALQGQNTRYNLEMHACKEGRRRRAPGSCCAASCGGHARLPRPRPRIGAADHRCGARRPAGPGRPRARHAPGGWPRGLQLPLTLVVRRLQVGATVMRDHTAQASILAANNTLPMFMGTIVGAAGDAAVVGSKAVEAAYRIAAVKGVPRSAVHERKRAAAAAALNAVDAIAVAAAVQLLVAAITSVAQRATVKVAAAHMVFVHAATARFAAGFAWPRRCGHGRQHPPKPRPAGPRSLL